MAGSMIKFDLTGDWKKLKMMLSGTQLADALKQNLRRATLLNAKLVRREVRKRIQANSYSANAALTIAVKGSSKPLVDNADLMNAVTDVEIDEKTAWVGVLKQAKSKDGDELINIAAIIHEGATIPVTEPMRALFQLLFEASRSGDPSRLTGRARELWDQMSTHGTPVFYPIGKDTTAIHVPARQFLRNVFEDPEVLKQLKVNWENAVAKAFKYPGV